MSRHVWTVLFVGLIGLSIVVTLDASVGADSSVVGDSAESLDAVTQGIVPLYFEENYGQTDPQVRYFARAGGYSMFATDTRIAFNLILDAPPAREPAHRHDFVEQESRDKAEPARLTRTYGLYLDFIDANASAMLSGDSLQQGISSYFHGSSDQWVTEVPHFGKVRYTQLYPGIDAVFYGSAQQVQYDFIVAPGADSSKIQLRFDPVEHIMLADDGDLHLLLGDRVLTMNAPYTYQTIDDEELEIESRFVLNDGTVTFSVGAYDTTLPLVIDPVIVYAGYIGGSGDEYGHNVAVDVNGSVYVTGQTASDQTSFPVTGGPDLIHDTGVDAFVAKVNPAGTALVYAGYIGGDGNDYGFGLAVDDVGNAYVTGDTYSSQSTFPVVNGPDVTYNGAVDGFIAKVNAAGSGLIYAGYIGGTGNDYGYDIALDSFGNAYVTGWTESTEASFPIAVGPDQLHNGAVDAFIAKVNTSGTSFTYIGYIGGSSDDFGNGVAVDDSGVAYVVGDTNSSEATFPVVVGPDLSFNGLRDAFVAKISANGASVLFAGYIGGAGSENGLDIAIDVNSNAYVVGITESDEASFPTLVGPDLTFNGGTWDVFVAKVNATGSALIYAGYIGGTGYDVGHDLQVDGGGLAYIVGLTDSTELTFPVMVGPDLTYNGGQYDAFVARIAVSGSHLFSAGYIGGSGSDVGRALAVDETGIYIVGGTSSDQSSFPVTLGPGLDHNGSFDAFVVKIREVDPLKNVGFEVADTAQASKAQYWTGVNLTKDKRICNTDSPPVLYSHSGNCAFLFKGRTGEKATIAQTVRPSSFLLQPGTSLHLSAWVNSPTNILLGKVVIYYTDGTRYAFSVEMGPSVGYSKYQSAPYLLAKNASKFKVSFKHTYPSGKLYLDDVALVPNAARRDRVLPLPIPIAPAFRRTQGDN